MRRKFYFYLAIVFTIAISIGSLTTFKSGEAVGFSISDKLVHSAAYFVLSLSWFFTLHNGVNWLKKSYLISVIIFLYGIVIEVLQEACTTYREFDLFDILANFVGIGIAFIIFNTVLKKNGIN